MHFFVAFIERVPDLQTVQLEVTENTNPTVDPKDTNHIEGPKNSKVEDTECLNEEGKYFTIIFLFVGQFKIVFYVQFI